MSLLVEVPATEIARKIGNTKAANMVLLGAFIAKTGIVNASSVFEAVESSMPETKKNGIADNKTALTEGIKYIEDKKS